MSKLTKYYYPNLFDSAANALLLQVQPIITEGTPAFVTRFYAELMAEPSAAAFLENDLAAKQLTRELAQWISGTFAPKNSDECLASTQVQRRIGEVHARAEIPMPLVDSAMTILKEDVFRALLGADLMPEIKTEAIILIGRITDSALSLINEAYLRGRVSHERSALEYRSASTAHELALEIERVKSGIYDWLTRQMLCHLGQVPPCGEDSVLTTDFGLWIKHKFRMISPSEAGYDRMIVQLHRINAAQTAVLELRDSAAAQLNAVKEMNSAAQEVIWLLTHEANSNLEKASHEDALTHLLERRFLSPILQQETQLAKKTHSDYAVIMLDLDQFKSINDIHGHLVGDRVLAFIGKAVKETIRVTDYAFRYGGEEILILLPSINFDAALKSAERLRAAVAAIRISLGDERYLSVTASFGLAMYQGHPDFNHVIRAADEKMYEAKNAGRNCVRY